MLLFQLKKLTHPTNLRRIGLSLFVFAFFLPATRFDSSTFGFETDMGWQCAQYCLRLSYGLIVYALHATHIYVAANSPDPAVIPIFALCSISGLINPLVLLSLIPWVYRKPKLVRGIAIAIVFCLVCTWALFVEMNIWPLVGHFFWVIGAALVVYANLYSTIKEKIKAILSL